MSRDIVHLDTVQSPIEVITTRRGLAPHDNGWSLVRFHNRKGVGVAISAEASQRFAETIGRLADYLASSPMQGDREEHLRAELDQLARPFTSTVAINAAGAGD